MTQKLAAFYFFKGNACLLEYLSPLSNEGNFCIYLSIFGKNLCLKNCGEKKK